MTQKDAEKTEKVEVRVTAEEKVILQKAAAQLDMTISDYFRFYTLKHAREIVMKIPVEQFRASVAGTADYMTLRYQASSYSPSPEPEPEENENES